MYKRFLSKMVLMVICLTLLVPKAGHATAPRASSDPERGTPELVQLRTATTKVYKTATGLQYQLSSAPVHFQDETGRWQPIAPAFAAIGGDKRFAFESQGVGFHVGLTNQPERNQVEVRSRSSALRFAIAENVGKPSALARARPTVGYRRADGSVDYEYELGANYLKETIFLRRPIPQSVFSFPLEVENATLVPRPDGSIAAIDSNGDEAWSIAAPIITDDAGVMGPIEQHIQERNGVTYLDLTVDEAWLRDSARKWPIAIDPTITMAPDSADGMDASLEYSGCESTSPSAGLRVANTYCYDSYGWQQYIYRTGLVKFNLSALPRGATVTAATLRLYQFEAGGSRLQSVKTAWKENELESDSLWRYPWNNNLGEELGQATGSANSWTQYSVPGIVGEWLSGVRPNHGFALNIGPCTGSCSKEITFRASGVLTDPAYYPQLVVEISPDTTPPAFSFHGIHDYATFSGEVFFDLNFPDPIDVAQVDLSVDGRLVAQWHGGNLPLLSDGSGHLTVRDITGIAPETEWHTAHARVTDRAGNATVQQLRFSLGAVEAPRTAGALGIGGGAIEVGWTPVPAAGYRYNIYRSTTSQSEGSLIASEISGTSYVDSTPAQGTLYFYRVKAVSANGVLSSPTPPAPAVAGVLPTVTISFQGDAVNQAVPQPWLGEASYYADSPLGPSRPEWSRVTRANGALAALDGQAFTSTSLTPGFVKGQLLTADLLGQVNHQRIVVGHPTLDAAEFAGLVSGASLSWAGVGQGANAGSLSYGARLRLWNASQGTYDLPVTQTASTITAVPAVQLDAAQTRQHVDPNGVMHLLAEPTSPADSVHSASVTSDHAYLTVTLTRGVPNRVAAAPLGNGQVLVTWAPAAADYYVHRGSTSGFMPDESNRISPLLSRASYTDSAATGLRPGVAYYYKVTVPGSAASSPASPGVTPQLNLAVVAAFAGTGTEAKGCSADFLSITALTHLDGKLATSSCGTTTKQTFDFDILTAARQQWGITSRAELLGRIETITVDWTGYGVATNSGNSIYGAAISLWDPTAWTWTSLPSGSDQVAARWLATTAAQSKWFDTKGIVKVGVSFEALNASLHTDYIRLILTLRPAASITATEEGFANVAISGPGQFQIYRSVTSGTGYVRVTPAPVGGAYVDRSVTRGAKYYYVLRPVWLNGDLGPASAEVPFTVPVQRMENPGFRTPSNWSTELGSPYSGGERKTTSLLSEYFVFDFTGTGAAVIASTGCFGKVRVELDYVDKGLFSLETAVPRDQQVIYQIQGLPMGAHKLALYNNSYSSTCNTSINIDAGDVYGPAVALPALSGVTAVYGTSGVLLQGLQMSDVADYRVYRSSVSGNWYEPVPATVNLLTRNQSNAETDTGGLTVTSTNPADLTRDATVSWEGTSSAKLTSNHAGGTQTIGVNTRPSPVPVAEGKVVTFSVQVKANQSGKQIHPVIWWVDAAGNPLTAFHSDVTVTNGYWQQVTATAAVPPNAATAYAEVLLDSAAAGEGFWWDAAQFEPAAHATDWTPGGTAFAPQVGSGYYVVSTVGRDGRESAPSAQIVSVASSNTPTNPTNLQAVSGRGKVELSWSGTTAAPSGYNVYRSSNSGGPYSRLNVSPVSGTSFIDTTPGSGTTYYYIVRGLGADGSETRASREAFGLSTESRLGIDGRWSYVSFGFGNGTGYAQTQTGNLVLPVTDLLIPANRMAVALRRTYNAADSAQQPGMPTGWRLNAHQNLVGLGTDTVVWVDGDGSEVRFERTGNAYVAESQTFVELEASPAGGWEVRHKQGSTFVFDSQGRLTAVRDRNGSQVEYSYDANGRLVSMAPVWTDGLGTATPIGGVWTLRYHASTGLLEEVEDGSGWDGTIQTGSGRKFRYGYDSNGRLLTVTDPAGAVTTYTYNPAGQLTQVSDAEGRSNWVAYTGDRVTSYGDAYGTWSLSYTGERTTVADPAGHPTTFVLGAHGRLLRHAGPLGAITDLTYDAQGNVVRLVDPLGRTASFTAYDQWGNPGKIADALSQETVLEYHPDFHTVTAAIRDTANRAQLIEYDGQGNPAKVSTGSVACLVPGRIAEPCGSGEPVQVASSSYDVYGLQRTATDPRGFVTTYEYDTRGWLQTTRPPLLTDSTSSGPTRYVYDGAGNLVTVTDPLNRTTDFHYDPAGRRTRVVHPDTVEELTFYDRAGYPTRTVDGVGAERRLIYDQAGRLTVRVDPLGHQTHYEYDVAGRQTGVVGPRGERSLTTFDALGRPIAITDPEGGTVYQAYDEVGNQVRITLANGYSVYAGYDQLNRQTQTIAPLESSVVRYDAAGNKALVRDAAGNWTRFVYDSLDRLSAVYDALNLDMDGNIRVTDSVGNPYTAVATRYGYDLAGNRASVTDANGNTTSYEYDGLNREMNETQPEGEVRTYRYDAASQVREIVNLASQTTRLFEYDLRGRVSDISHVGASGSVAYTYDGVGRPLTVTNEQGSIVRRYDLAGQLLNELNPLGNGISYQYDASGNRTGMIHPEGTWAYAYDRANRLTTTTAPDGVRVTYTLAPDGRVLRTDLPYGYSQLNGYDPITNRRIELGYRGNSLAETFSYQYDLKGNVTRVSHVSGSSTTTTTYGYDVIDRLIRSSNGDTSTDYSYDAVGNRNKAVRYNGLSYTDTYQYDRNNRLLRVTTSGGASATKSFSYDTAGRVTQETGSSLTYRYTYDGFDRLLSVRKTGSQTDLLTSYGYDGDGRRLNRRLLDYWSSPEYVEQSDAVYYQHDGPNVIAERDGTGLSLGFVTRGGGGQLLALHRTGKPADVYLTDRLGSVIGLAGGAGIANRYSYGDFGNVTSSSEPVSNDWKFTGAPFDSQPGLYHLGARYYNPNDGRFITQDTYKGNAWEPWTQNLYSYVYNNPVNLTDPTGHFACPAEIPNCEEAARTTLTVIQGGGGAAAAGAGTSWLARLGPVGVFLAVLLTPSTAGETDQDLIDYDLSKNTELKAALDADPDTFKKTLNEKHYRACQSEMAGAAVAYREAGKPFDHCKEIWDAQQGVLNKVNQMKDFLNDSRLYDPTTELIQQRLSTYSRMLDASESFFRVGPSPTNPLSPYIPRGVYMPMW